MSKSHQNILIVLVISCILAASAYGIYGNFYGNNGSLLQAAVDKNWVAVVRLLLLIGVDPNNKDGVGLTPLTRAVQNRDLNMMKILLKHGANIHVKDISGVNLISISLCVRHKTPQELDKSFTIMKYLFINHAASINEINSSDAVLFAIMANNIAAVQYLLAEGVSIIPRKNASPSYVLDVATWNDNVEMVRLLIHYGADYKIHDQFGDSPIQVAQTCRHPAVAAYLKSLNTVQTNMNSQNRTMP